MNKTVFLSVAILACLFLSSCELRLERELSRGLEGDWSISEMILRNWNGSGQDSLISGNDLGKLSIDFCRDPQGQECEMRLTLPGGNMQEYSYQLSAFEDGEDVGEMSLSPTNPDPAVTSFPYNWVGLITIEFLDENNLELFIGMTDADLFVILER